MPREKEAYRDNLERIKNMYPDKELLRVSEVMRFLGMKNYNSVLKRFPFKDNYISVATLARELS